MKKFSMLAAICLVTALGQSSVVQLFYDDFTGTTLHPRWTVVNGFDSTGAGFIGTNYGTEANGGAMSTALGGYAYASLAGIPSDAKAIIITWAAWEHGNNYWSILSVDGTHSSPTTWAPTNGAFVCARTETEAVYTGGTGSGATSGIWSLGIKGAWRQYELVLSGKSGVVNIKTTVRDAAGNVLGIFPTYKTSAAFEANYVSIAGSIGDTAWIDNVKVSYVPATATYWHEDWDLYNQNDPVASPWTGISGLTSPSPIADINLTIITTTYPFSQDRKMVSPISFDKGWAGAYRPSGIAASDKNIVVEGTFYVADGTGGNPSDQFVMYVGAEANIAYVGASGVYLHYIPDTITYGAKLVSTTATGAALNQTDWNKKLYTGWNKYRFILEKKSGVQDVVCQISPAGKNEWTTIGSVQTDSSFSADYFAFQIYWFGVADDMKIMAPGITCQEAHTIGFADIADISGDCKVNLDDLALLAGGWLNCVTTLDNSCN